MSNYTQELWQDRNYDSAQHGRAARAAAWTVGALAGIAVIAFFTERFWYPFVQQYL